MAIPRLNNEICAWITPCSARFATTGRCAEVESLFAMPFLDLLFHAQRVHRQHQEPSTVQMSTLLSIKTGACPEDCKYCSQSVRYDTGLERETLLEIEQVVDSARAR